MYKKLVTCLESVRKKIDFKPEVALILGSDLEILQMESRLSRPSIIQRLKDFRFLQ